MGGTKDFREALVGVGRPARSSVAGLFIVPSEGQVGARRRL